MLTCILSRNMPVLRDGDSCRSTAVNDSAPVTSPALFRKTSGTFSPEQKRHWQLVLGAPPQRSRPFARQGLETIGRTKYVQVTAVAGRAGPAAAMPDQLIGYESYAMFTLCYKWLGMDVYYVYEYKVERRVAY